MRVTVLGSARIASLLRLAALHSIAAGLAVTISLSKTQAHANETNLIGNGSFEDGVHPPDNPGYLTLNPGSTDIDRWTVTRGGIDYYGTGWVASDGHRSLDLNGTPGVGGVAQTFATTPGQKYRVIFDMAGHNSGLLQTMRVRAAGQYYDFTFQSHGDPQNLGWQTRGWEFTANAFETTLEFYSLQTGYAFGGPALDNVRVVQMGAVQSIAGATQRGALTVEKRSASDNAAGMVLYTIAVTNNSDTDATKVRLDDQLPSELWPIIAFCSDHTLHTIMATHGSCYNTGSPPIKVHCDLGTIGAGAKAYVTYSVQVMSTASVEQSVNAGSPISNIVTFTSDQSNPRTVRETVRLATRTEISDKELNDIIDAIRECPVFTNLPLLGLANLYVTQLQRGEISRVEFQTKLIEATLELIAHATKSAAVGFMTDLFFNIQSCIDYGRLLFSISGYVNTPTTTCQ